MAVWTIAADEATGGGRGAADLASAAEVPLLDRRTLALLAHDLQPELLDLDQLERIDEHLGGRLASFGLSMAAASVPGCAEALREFELRKTLPSLGRAVVGEAARRPCVILASAAFAALPSSSAAVHVRLRAPFEYRIAAYQREHLVDRHAAERALRHSDQHTRAWVKALYHVDIDDERRFSLVIDTSRFSADRLVDVLLAAGGSRARRPAVNELEAQTAS